MQLALLVIKTHQIDMLKDFYQALGLSFIVEKHGNGPEHYSCDLDGTVMEIYPLPEGGPLADTTTRLGFRVKNLENVVEYLEGNHTPVINRPKRNDFGYFAVVKDPDGRMVVLYEA
jgi:lactoylglutathione lyase